MSQLDQCVVVSRMKLSLGLREHQFLPAAPLQHILQYKDLATFQNTLRMPSIDSFEVHCTIEGTLSAKEQSFKTTSQSYQQTASETNLNMASLVPLLVHVRDS